MCQEADIYFMVMEACQCPWEQMRISFVWPGDVSKLVGKQDGYVLWIFMDHYTRETLQKMILVYLYFCNGHSTMWAISRFSLFFCSHSLSLSLNTPHEQIQDPNSGPAEPPHVPAAVLQVVYLK